MRRLFLTFILVATASLAISQHTDIIKLHSSEIVRGSITETIPGVSVSIIALPDSVLRIIPFSEIEQVIYKEGTAAINKSTSVRQSPENSKSGQSTFKGFIRTGYSAQMKEDDIFVSNSFFKADIILGASFAGKTSLGVGFGVRLGQNDHTLLPLFLDLRIAPLEGNVSPVGAISFGVNFQTDMNYNVQKFINPELGIRLGKPKGTHVIFAFGVELFDYFTERKVPTNVFGGLKNTSGSMNYQAYSFSVMLGF